MVAFPKYLWKYHNEKSNKLGEASFQEEKGIDDAQLDPICTTETDIDVVIILNFFAFMGDMVCNEDERKLSFAVAGKRVNITVRWYELEVDWGQGGQTTYVTRESLHASGNDHQSVWLAFQCWLIWRPREDLEEISWA